MRAERKSVGEKIKGVEEGGKKIRRTGRSKRKRERRRSIDNDDIGSGQSVRGGRKREGMEAGREREGRIRVGKGAKRLPDEEPPEKRWKY